MKKERCDTKWPVYRIERKKGVRYYAVYSMKNGKQVTKTLRTKNDAILWLKQQHSKVTSSSSETSYVHGQKTVGWLCDYWMENYAVLYKSKSSVSRNESKIRNHILPELGTVRLSQLTGNMIEEWMGKLRKKLSPKTCNLTFGILQKMLSDAKRWKFIENNPTFGVPRFKVPERDFNCWTVQEKTAFLRFIHTNKPEAYPLFLTALSTGLRLGELRGLQWHCIDFENGKMTAKQAYCDYNKCIVSHTKSFRVRRLPLNKQLMECLAAEKARSTSKDVFSHLDIFINASTKLKKLCKRAGVPEIRFHDLRHVFASHLAMAGVSLYDLQKLMGHQSITMTERYSHLIPEALMGLTEALTVPVSIEERAKANPAMEAHSELRAENLG